ncbi:MAG: BatA domain-containing protein [Candidatus Riflebacteria bacterium]|nr:BatA domain-containing protein [Candidatus Riflebacteria bacterium]
MAFVNPWMLVGLVAAAVPIVLHLKRQKRAVPKRWAAFRLLMETRTVARRAAIEHWLLLLARVLIVALLVLAFARPGAYLGMLAGRGGQGKAVVVALDTSFSMGLKLNDTPKFTLAKERILSHLDRLSLDSGTAILFSDRPREPLAGFTGDVAAIRETVERATLSAGGTDGNAALRRAVALLDTRDVSERLILVYSDFHRSGWDLADLGRLDEEIRGKHLAVALVGLRGEGADDDNQAVTGLELESDIVTRGEPVSLRISFANFHGSRRQRTFSVVVDGQTRHVQRIDLEAAGAAGPGRAVARVPLTFAAEGFHSGQVSIDPDDVEVDDSRYFAVQVVPRLKVLLVDGDPQLDRSRSETFLLEKLLGAAGNVDATVVAVWDLGSAVLSLFDVVVFANVDSISPEKFSETRDFVQRGGGLVYFPGDKVYPEDFLRCFTAAGSAGPSPGSTATRTGDERLRAVPEGIFPGYPQEWSTGAELRLDARRAEFGHPVLRRFRGAELAAARFRRVLRFKELDATAVPLRHDDGSPALLERGFGAGRVLVFTSACDADGSDLLLTGSTAGLPLAAIYHASGRGQGDWLNGTVGGNVTIHLPLDRVGRSIRVFRPGRPPVTQAGRATRRGDCVAELADASEAGLYRFEVDGGPGGAVAMSFDPRESDRAPIDPSAIAAVLKNAKVSVQIEDLLDNVRPLGSDGWLVLVLAVVALLAVEGVLANKNL